MTRRTAVAFALASAAVVLVAGCSSASEGTGSPAPTMLSGTAASAAPAATSPTSPAASAAPTGPTGATQPCALITAADATTLFGGDAQQPAPTALSPDTACSVDPVGFERSDDITATGAPWSLGMNCHTEQDQKDSNGYSDLEEAIAQQKNAADSSQDVSGLGSSTALATTTDVGGQHQTWVYWIHGDAPQRQEWSLSVVTTTATAPDIATVVALAKTIETRG